MMETTPVSSSSASTSPPPPLCKHWARSKVCLYHNGGRCKFSHPSDYEVPIHVATSSNNKNHRHRSTGGRLQTRNDTRVAKFRSFIASHEKIDLSKCNILDVAGGKGELSFQLLNLSNALTCHVIDPRPLSLSRFQKRLKRGFYHRSASVLGSMHDIARQRDDGPERPVGHLRCFFRDELWKTEQGHTSSNDKNENDDNNRSTNHQIFESNCHKTQNWTWPPVGGNNEHTYCNSNNCGHHQEEDENDEHFTTIIPQKTEETLTYERAFSTVKKANLIVGMHPDQAVDAIVDAALYLNISFFVVPCCTYSREFPHRRLNTGNTVSADNANINNNNNNINKRVTTYSDLLEYLQAKSPDIQRHVLPFEGKNVCLYRIV